MAQRWMRRWRVREVAQQQGVSLSELTRRSGLNRKTIGRIWHDPALSGKLSTLERLAEALQVPCAELIEHMVAPLQAEQAENEVHNEPEEG